MAKKNELAPLVVSLAISLALLLGSAWWLKNNIFGDGGLPNGPGISGGTGGEVDPNFNTGPIDLSGADGSVGQTILPQKAGETTSASKQKGLQALADGDFAAAQVELSAALKANRNDPEARIYLNNAEIGKARAYTLAISVPAGSAEKPAAELLRGAAQAQTDVNRAGGINGIPLRLLVIDDQDNAERAQAIAAKLVNTPNVLGVVGHFSSGTTLAAAPVYEQGQLPMVSPTSTAVKISEAGDYIFRTVPSDRLAAATLSRHVLNQLNVRQAAVFYTSESAYSQSVKSEFTTELLSNGGQVVAEFDVSQNFDAGSAVQAAITAGAEVLTLALNTATLDIANQIITVNRRELPMVGGDSLYNPDVLEFGQANALGLTVAAPWHILSHEGSKFVRNSRDLWGGDVNWRTATAYDAVMALVAGITNDPTREGIAQTLGQTNFVGEGATSLIKFLPTGDRNQPSQLVEVVEGDRSSFGYDYVPVN